MAKKNGEKPDSIKADPPKSPHINHRQRVRDEFLQHGLDHFTHHKMLEFLLFHSVPRQDTNPAGHMLMDRFGSLSGVFDADYELLLEAGLSKNSAALIKLVAALSREYLDDYSSVHNSITEPQAAKEYMRHKFLALPTECLLLACMGHNGKVVYCCKLAAGTPESVSISPGQVVKTALRANAVTAVLAHNHPNGFCIPSNKDLMTTSILWEALKGVDVELIDHIIVAADGVYSMAENNMLPRPGR